MAIDLPPQSPAPIVQVVAADRPVQPAASPAPASRPIVLRGCTRMEQGKGVMLPMKGLSDYLHRRSGREGPKLVGAHLRLLRPPSHGDLLPDPVPSETGARFMYLAKDAAWLGVDQVGFEVRYAGRDYRIEMRIEMVPYVDQDENTGAPYDGSCDPRLRRADAAAANPVTQGFISWVQPAADRAVFPRLRGGASGGPSVGSQVRT